MKGLMKTILGACVVAIGVTTFAGTAYADTGLYVGKDVSADGTIIIGRSSEYEIGMLQYADVVEAGDIKAGDTIIAANGFTYTLPEDCLKYNYFKNMDYFKASDSAEPDRYYQSATNECGVTAIPASTAYANEKALEADPYVEDGLSEELISQVLVLNSRTAREAVELLVSIVDENGSDYSNVVLISDPNEAWVVELLTGHQYVAMKLPDDVVSVFGNEFIIKTINPEEEDVIVSPDLYTIAEKNNFIVYDENENIDLFATYSAENMDLCHMRTWIGHELLAPSESVEYSTDVEIPGLYAPDKKVTLKDVFALYRNRFEGTEYDLEASLENTNNYGNFSISKQYTGGVYISQTYSDVPAEMSVVTWATPANPGFSPFLPYVNGADEIPEAYKKNVAEERYDEESAVMKYAALNAECFARRIADGGLVRTIWDLDELIYTEDVSNKINEWAELYNQSERRAVKEINGFVDSTFAEALRECEGIKNELEWHHIRDGIFARSISDAEIIEVGLEFAGPFEIEGVASEAGWDAETDGNVLTLTKGDKKIVFDPSAGGSATFYGFEEKDFDGLPIVDYEEETDEEIDGETEETVSDDVSESVETEEITEDKEEPVKEDEDINEDKEDVKEEQDDAKVETSEEVQDKRNLGKASEDEYEDIFASDPDMDLGDVTFDDFEVGLLFEVEKFFAGEIDEIPELGLSRAEAEKFLQNMTDESVKIVEDYFDKNIDEISYYDLMDSTVQADVQAEVQAELDAAVAEASTEITKLLAEYYTQELVDTAVEFGKQVPYDELANIVADYAVNTTGMIKAYLLETIDPVINTDLSREEVMEIIEELGTNAKAILEGYLGYEIDSIDINVDLAELGFDLTDEDVIDIMTNLDPEVIDGLSEILGVDVGQAIDDFVIKVEESKASSKPGKGTTVEFKVFENKEYDVSKAITEEVQTVAEPKTDEPVYDDLLDGYYDEVFDDEPALVAASDTTTDPAENKPVESVEAVETSLETVAIADASAETANELNTASVPEVVEETPAQETGEALYDDIAAQTEESTDINSENVAGSASEEADTSVEPGGIKIISGIYVAKVGGKIVVSSNLLKFLL